MKFLLIKKYSFPTLDIIYLPIKLQTAKIKLKPKNFHQINQLPWINIKKYKISKCWKKKKQDEFLLLKYYIVWLKNSSRFVWRFFFFFRHLKEWHHIRDEYSFYILLILVEFSHKQSKRKKDRDIEYREGKKRWLKSEWNESFNIGDCCGKTLNVRSSKWAHSEIVELPRRKSKSKLLTLCPAFSLSKIYIYIRLILSTFHGDAS